MKKLTISLLAVIVCQAIALAQVTGTWLDARFMKKPMHNVLVVPQFIDNQQRVEAGDALVRAFSDKGVGAVPASGIIHYDSMYYYSTLERKLDSAGVDGILIIRLAEVRGTDMYILPGEAIPPFAYNYYEYYSYYYYHDMPIISDPNYYRKPGLSFRIDMYLYRNKGDMAVWGGQTRVVDPMKPVKSWDKMAKKIVKILRSEGLVSAGS